MAKQIQVTSPDMERSYPYTLIETIEDIDEVFCHAPKHALLNHFYNGENIIVNPNGGYCFLEEGYHEVTSPLTYNVCINGETIGTIEASTTSSALRMARQQNKVTVTVHRSRS